MAYEKAKKYVYDWNEMDLARLNLQDAVEVDGDKHIVVCYVFKQVLE